MDQFVYILILIAPSFIFLGDLDFLVPPTNKDLIIKVVVEIEFIKILAKRYLRVYIYLTKSFLSLRTNL